MIYFPINIRVLSRLSFVFSGVIKGVTSPYFLPFEKAKTFFASVDFQK